MSDPNSTQPGHSPRKPPPDPAPQTAPHPRPEVHVSGAVGGNVVGGDLNQQQTAGRDVVGRDVVTTTSTTNVGFSARMVQSLLITVAALVAGTAACFFVLGSVTAVGVVAAFQRPVNSNNQAAANSFLANLAALQALPPGQPFEFSFSEDDISSYFHLMLEPTLNGEITDGQVRLLDDRHLALSGQTARLGGLRVAATFAWQANQPGAPLKLTGALVHLLPLGDSPLGWVPLPIAALRPVESMLNGLFGKTEITAVSSLPEGHGWDVTVVGH